MYYPFIYVEENTDVFWVIFELLKFIVLTRQYFVSLGSMDPKRYMQTDHDTLVFHLLFQPHEIDVSRICNKKYRNIYIKN